MHITQVNKNLLPQFLQTQHDEEHRYQSPRRVTLSQTPPTSLTPKRSIQILGANPISFGSTTSKSIKSTIINGSPYSNQLDNTLTKSVQILKPISNPIPIVRETIVMNQAHDEQNQKLISNLLSELDLYKNKCTHMEHHLYTITTELQNLKQTQSQIDQLLLDNDRVNDALEEKIKEVNLWKQKYEIEITNNQKSDFIFTDDRLQQLLKQKEDEIASLGHQIINFEQEIQQLYTTIQTKDEIINTLSQNLSDTKRIEDEVVKKSKIIWKKKENEFVDEINEQQIQLNNAAEEREKWRFKYLEAEKQRGELRVQYETLKQEAISVKQENERYNQALKQKQQDFEKLQSASFAIQQQLDEKNNQIKEYQYKYENVEQKAKDSEELRTKTYQQQNQIEQLKKSIFIAEEQLKDSSMVQSENAKLSQKLSQLERQSQEQNNELLLLNEKIEFYKVVEQEKDVLTQRINNLQSQFEKQREQIQSLESENQLLQEENRSISDQLRSSNEENTKLKEIENTNISQIEDLQNKILNLQLEMEVDKSEKKNLKNQIIHLNERMSQKDKIIEEMNKLNEKIDQEIQRNERLVQEIVSQNKLLDQKSVEYEQLKMKNQNFKEQLLFKNEQVQQLKSDQLIYQKEIERLTNSLSMKNNQIEILSLQMQELQLKSQELQSDQYDRNDQIVLFTKEIDRLNGSLQKRMKEIELLRQKQIFSKGLDSIDFKINSPNVYNSYAYDDGSDSPCDRKISEVQFQEIHSETLMTNLKSQNEILQKQLAIFEKEIQKKDCLIDQKQKEYELIKQKMLEINERIENMYSQEDQNKALEIQIYQLRKEKQQLLNELENIKYQLSEYSHLGYKVQDLQYQLVISRILLESQSNQLKYCSK
ncbi:hypothetical protein TTHERM_00048760 (macronuclear) [Tetrahymena thermophila SB210]|uniref:Uncharacterized protein n=1 Tax=Tetrahymena thermophila (strain SB210) TaxID=312017 RepID=Q23DB4_TETTS|nr:hypothetical protein TTHERM_00048760 [Tetrahymena thermophila SB210]EAR94411.2 hypothetical protein TTHERM_00048760 [Tetrahymena thermophila SB210]|eukprot:XP_001014772.2 hypothetical protein TTHERM_00048760 [Tetrahymena thermophila SB210]